MRRRTEQTLERARLEALARQRELDGAERTRDILTTAARREAGDAERARAVAAGRRAAEQRAGVPSDVADVARRLAKLGRP